MTDLRNKILENPFQKINIPDSMPFGNVLHDQRCSQAFGVVVSPVYKPLVYKRTYLVYVIRSFHAFTP